MARRGSSTGKPWRPTSRIWPAGCSGERTERSRCVERTSRRRTGGNGRSEFPRWKTSWSSAPSSRCSTPSTNTDFLGFSYGFRPGRSPHQALDALSVGLETKKVNWVLDADIRGFFDTLDHGWLIRFIEHRVADRRVVRLIQKWLAAGVLEDGQRTVSEVGTVQGGSVSPLLANLYLHYVFDLWVQRWRTTQAQRRRGRRAVRGRFRRRIPASRGSRTLPRRVARALRAVRVDAASRQDAPHRIRPLRGPESASPRRREAGNLQLSRLHA